MIDHYEVAGNVVELTHANDVFSKKICDEFGPYLINLSDKERFAASWRFILDNVQIASENPSKKTTINDSLPAKAILAVPDIERPIYLHENKSYMLKMDHYIIIVDYTSKTITARYITIDPFIVLQIRALIKWAFIRGSEAKGVTFIHGSAVCYNGKNIVFTGDSRSGKSSSMMRLVNEGAKIISDDSVLVKGDTLIPFYIGMTINEDFSKRFGISDGMLGSDKYVDIRDKITGIDYLIFLKRWNNPYSEIASIDKNKALLHLIRMYKKEAQGNLLFDWDKDAPETNKTLFNKYSDLLRMPRCYEFYAGYEESEVREKLLRFFNEN